MAGDLSRCPADLAAMSEEEFITWIGAVSTAMEEAAERKGFRQYVVEDALAAADSVGRRIAEVVEEYRMMRDAQQQAERAERRAETMRQRLLQRKQELGRER